MLNGTNRKCSKLIGVSIKFDLTQFYLNYQEFSAIRAYYVFSEKEDCIGKVFSFSLDCQCYYFQKNTFLQNEIFSVWVFPLVSPLFPSSTLGPGRRQNTVLLVGICFFSAFFPAPLQHHSKH